MKASVLALADRSRFWASPPILPQRTTKSGTPEGLYIATARSHPVIPQLVHSLPTGKSLNPHPACLS